MNRNSKIIYTGEDGVVAVVHPAPKFFENLVHDGKEIVHSEAWDETIPAVTETKVIPAVTETQPDPETGELVEVVIEPERTEEVILEPERIVHHEAVTETIPAFTEEMAWQKMIEMTFKQGLPPDMEIVPDTAIPADRTFRNAWRKGKACVECDMNAAKEIAKERVREARAPKLEKLDVESLREKEKPTSPDKMTDILNKKQQLRDATADSRIVSAATEEDLKAGMEAVIEEVKNVV